MSAVLYNLAAEREKRKHRLYPHHKDLAVAWVEFLFAWWGI